MNRVIDNKFIEIKIFYLIFYSPRFGWGWVANEQEEIIKNIIRVKHSW